MGSYQEFVSSEFKKRPQGVKPSEYMKVISKKWHKQKGVKKGKGVVKWFKQHVPSIISTVKKISGIDELVKEHKDVLKLIKEAIKSKSIDEFIAKGKPAYIQICKVVVKDALIYEGYSNVVTNKLVDWLVPPIVGAVYDLTIAQIKQNVELGKKLGGEVVVGPYTEITKDVPDFYNDIFNEMYIDPYFTGGPYVN